MALIRMERNTPPFMTSNGSANAGGGTTTKLFNFATSVLKSNRITVTSASRIDFIEPGTYEVWLPTEVTLSGAVGVNIQAGISGSWTTVATSNGVSTNFGDNQSFFVEVVAGDYLELRAQCGSASITNANCGSGSAVLHGSFMIRKL